MDHYPRQKEKRLGTAQFTKISKEKEERRARRGRGRHREVREIFYQTKRRVREP